MTKRTISELQKAEEKYQALINKRNALNDEANEIRKTRDMLNDQKRQMLDAVYEVKKSKDSKAAEMREHKNRRNELNRQAKELISLKRELHKSSPDSEVFGELERLAREFETLELRQQTESMSIADENDLIQRMRNNLAERNKLTSIARKSEQIVGRVDELNSKIDEIFESSRKEHESVVSIYAEVQALGEEMNTKMNEISVIINEANKRHQEFLDKRAEADKTHHDAMEMRSLILERRKERRESFLEGKRAISELNTSARKNLFDKEASEKEADKQLQELLKRGKINLR
jgi:uncharacterized coiled-coil DUF342 family protein